MSSHGGCGGHGGHSGHGGRAYYNEIDPFASEWLKWLIEAEAIAFGDVDTRSIRDVTPGDVKGYTQCHFFAGIGGWSYALRLAGWPDDRPIWTGSCPCQPFSTAGKGDGFDDERHLWPAFHHLIRECRPPVVVGEQVEAAIRHGWLDLVQADLEGEGYRFGAAGLPAAGVGAPHIRQRLYFVADTECRSTERQRFDVGAAAGKIEGSTQERKRLRNDACNGRIAGASPDTTGARCDDAGEHGSGWPLLPARPEQRGDIGIGPDTEHDGHDTTQRVEAVAHSNQPEIGIPDGDCGGKSCKCADSGSARCEGHRPEQVHRGRNHSGADLCVTGSGSIGDGEHSNGDGSLTRGIAGTPAGYGSPTDSTGGSIDGSDTTQRGLPMHGSAPGDAGHTTQPSQPFSGDNAIGTRLEGHSGDAREWCGPGWLDPITARSVAEAGATGGFWADCDWWYGRDGKFRPAQPGIFPLAHGVPNRVGLLRGYGNAIVPQVAAEFVKAYMHVSAQAAQAVEE